MFLNLTLYASSQTTVLKNLDKAKLRIPEEELESVYKYICYIQ